MKSLQIVVLFLIVLSCKGQKILNGRYCAEIERYNPKTQKESSYRSIINIQDNILYEIEWPNGGHSDSDEFGYPLFENSKVSFSDKRNVQFKIEVIGSDNDCFDNEITLVQCKGTTKKKKQCQRKTGHPSGYCHYHRKQ